VIGRQELPLFQILDQWPKVAHIPPTDAQGSSSAASAENDAFTDRHDSERPKAVVGVQLAPQGESVDSNLSLSRGTEFFSTVRRLTAEFFLLLAA
jgi:hypothetical protein